MDRDREKEREGRERKRETETETDRPTKTTTDGERDRDRDSNTDRDIGIDLFPVDNISTVIEYNILYSEYLSVYNVISLQHIFWLIPGLLYFRKSKKFDFFLF